MAKRLSINQKKEITQNFFDGKNVEFLSKKFKCTNLTIIRNLKKELGEQKYKELSNSSKLKKENVENFNNDSSCLDLSEIENLNQNGTDFFPEAAFSEISPLEDYVIDDLTQKELSSVPISDIKFPKIVYMIVDKKLELEIKLLKDFPSWSFLPANDLSRKTIEIYLDLNIAKRFCDKDQKVIKVPNTDVFKIAAPFLISRGISRIISEDKLISL